MDPYSTHMVKKEKKMKDDQKNSGSEKGLLYFLLVQAKKKKLEGLGFIKSPRVGAYGVESFSFLA